MMKTAAIVAGLLVLRSVGPAQERERDTHDFLGLGKKPDAQAAARGEPLYKQQCAGCHGANARGAQGPNLVRSPLVLHDEKGEAIGELLRQGRPASGMPAFPQLKPDEVYAIAEYLHLQVEQAANRGLYNSLYAQQRGKTSGDAERGKRYFGANCAECHSESKDLAHVAARYPEAATLQARWLWPASRAPKAATANAGGQQFAGTIVKMDDFDVVMRDERGEVHTWRRDEVELKIDDKLAGHRALFARYTDRDMHDVTAYLQGLK